MSELASIDLEAARCMFALAALMLVVVALIQCERTIATMWRGLTGAIREWRRALAEQRAGREVELELLKQEMDLIRERKTKREPVGYR
jgi:Sec-independent protein translocase protein TatA